MNIIFMRHGEATDNVKEIISDKEIYWSVLTENGKKTVSESIEALPKKIDKIYVSPFPRTIETAHFVFEKYPMADFVIEQKLFVFGIRETERSAVDRISGKCSFYQWILTKSIAYLSRFGIIK